MKPVSANFHIWRPCNDDCRFCFATFKDVSGYLSEQDAVRVLELLREAGCEKINFAGGEPTLYPHVGRVVRESRRLGFVVSIISNGARLRELLEGHARDLDWVGISVDSASEETQQALGRGHGDHVARATERFELARSYGLRTKLNSVITSLNWREDMSDFVRGIRPERWKVFRVLPITGQNDGRVESLLISSSQFASFVERHAALVSEGLGPVVEDNDDMSGSYVMIDPLGRMFGNVTGRHVYSDPILDVGVAVALRQVGWSAQKFVERGGIYDWAPNTEQPLITLRRPH